jgi:pimeloyl-ACP methyl ester carboxylesterase
MKYKIAWHKFGAGEPIVLLHGGHGSWQHWLRNIEALAQHGHILVPDMPSYGQSDALQDPTMTSLVNTTRAAVDEWLGSDTPVRLVGFSFGGLVAAQIAAIRPNITHLALLGSAGHGTTRRPIGKLLDWKEASRANDETTVREVMRHNLLTHMLAHESSVDAESLAIHTNACMKTRFHSKKISHAGGLVEALTTARQINPSMTLIGAWGERDVTCTPQAVLDVMLPLGLTNERSLIVANAGHWVQYEAADAINTFLLNHLLKQ